MPHCHCEKQIKGKGLQKYSNQAKRVLNNESNILIKQITIKRAPVSGVLTGALDVFSMGKFGKRMLKNFDELFHLFIEISLDNGKRLNVEKNERINIEYAGKERPKTESRIINNIPQDLTIKSMLDKAKERMGIDKFFAYNAVNNNCQDFIMALLQSSNVGNQDDYNFVKQDTQYLFQNLPHLKGLAKGVTDLGAVVGDTTDSIESASKKVSREVDKSTRDVSRNFKKFFQGRGYSLVI
jgi:hypothetical protein